MCVCPHFLKLCNASRSIKASNAFLIIPGNINALVLTALVNHCALSVHLTLPVDASLSLRQLYTAYTVKIASRMSFHPFWNSQLTRAHAQHRDASASCAGESSARSASNSSVRRSRKSRNVLRSNPRHWSKPHRECQAIGHPTVTVGAANANRGGRSVTECLFGLCGRKHCGLDGHTVAPYWLIVQICCSQAKPVKW